MATAYQAFRIGRATYGTQFHFKASRPVVADWLRRFPDRIYRMAPGWGDQHPDLAETAGAAAYTHGLIGDRRLVRNALNFTTAVTLSILSQPGPSPPRADG